MDVCLVSVVCYQVQVPATGRSLVQRSPIECGVYGEDCTSLLYMLLTYTEEL